MGRAFGHGGRCVSDQAVSKRVVSLGLSPIRALSRFVAQKLIDRSKGWIVHGPAAFPQPAHAFISTQRHRNQTGSPSPLPLVLGARAGVRAQRQHRGIISDERYNKRRERATGGPPAPVVRRAWSKQQRRASLVHASAAPMASTANQRLAVHGAMATSNDATTAAIVVRGLTKGRGARGGKGMGSLTCWTDAAFNPYPAHPT